MHFLNTYIERDTYTHTHIYGQLLGNSILQGSKITAEEISENLITDPYLSSKTNHPQKRLQSKLQVLLKF